MTNKTRLSHSILEKYVSPKLLIVSVIVAVTNDLRRRILEAELAPGTALSEIEIAESYSVARPTAKAAIENLVRDRMLIRRAHKTARVVRLTPEDAHDIYRARAMVESDVLRALAQTRTVPELAREANNEIRGMVGSSPQSIIEPDMRFHRALVDSVGSERISRIYESIAGEVMLCMSQVQGAELLPTALIADEHDRLLKLVEGGEGEEAARLLAVNLGRARERLVEQLRGVAGREAVVGTP